MEPIRKRRAPTEHGQTPDEKPRLRGGLWFVLSLACWLGLGLITVAIVAATSSATQQQATLHAPQILR